MRIQPQSTDAVDEVNKPQGPSVVLARCLLEVLESLIDDSWTHEQRVDAYNELKPELERIVRGRRG